MNQIEVLNLRYHKLYRIYETGILSASAVRLNWCVIFYEKYECVYLAVGYHLHANV